MHNHKKEKRSAKVLTSKEFVLGKGQERSSRTPTLGFFLFNPPKDTPWASIEMLDTPNIRQIAKQINIFLVESLPSLPENVACLGADLTSSGLALVHREPRPPYSVALVGNHSKPGAGNYPMFRPRAGFPPDW